MMKRSANDRFVGEVRKLIEILVATDRQTEAETIRNQALVVLNDPRLQSAIATTLAQVTEHKKRLPIGSLFLYCL